MPILTYADLDYYPSSAEVDAVLYIVAPIVGNGSLLVYRVAGAGSPSLTMAPKLAVVPTQGVTRGRLRGLMTELAGTGNSQGYGLLCMQSQRDLSSTGVAYGLWLKPGAASLTLCKLSSGFAVAPTILDTIAVTVGPVQALQLEWLFAPSVGGVALLASYGAQADFSDLTQVMAYQDLVSPLTTSVTEGAFYYDGGAGFDFQILYDQLRLDGP